MTNTELDALLVELEGLLGKNDALNGDENILIVFAMLGNSMRALRDAIAALRALRVQRERLREALRPFAEQTRASCPTEAAMIVRARTALGDA